VPEESVGRGADCRLVILRSGKTGPLRSRWKLPALKTRLAIARGCGLIYDAAWLGVHNGNAGHYGSAGKLKAEIPVDAVSGRTFPRGLSGRQLSVCFDERPDDPQNLSGWPGRLSP
jgi:hypothetical protein